MTRLRPADLARLTEGGTVAKYGDSGRLAAKVDIAAIHAKSFRFCAPLPPRSAHPNSRSHWAVKARDVAQYRKTVKYCIFDAAGTVNGAPTFERAAMDLEYVFTTARRRDGDNLTSWAKSLIDGMRDAGLLTDDSLAHLTVRSVTARKAGRIGGVLQQPGVQVWLEEVE